jgi:nucleotide-binding universal stress UspA family protein
MRILYATDGSEYALAGAQFLAALPLDATSTVHVVSVEQGAAGEEATRASEAALHAAGAVLHSSAARIENFVGRGNAAEQILTEAEAWPADLVVVGSRGRSAIARFFVGSVAERVVAHAPCSVLLARPLLRDAVKQIVLGTDGSQSAAQAAAWLRERFPLPDGCRVHLVSVIVPVNAVSASRMTLVPSMGNWFVRLAEQEQDAAREHLETLAAAFQTTGRPVTVEVRADDAAGRPARRGRGARGRSARGQAPAATMAWTGFCWAA